MPRLLVVVSCVVSTTACGDDSGPPERLLDGSRVEAPKVGLEGVDAPPIATKVDVIRSDVAASCLGPVGSDAANAPAVSRIGVSGRSVTVRAASGRALHACDASTSQGSWCGRAYGRLQEGRLTDPRLDLTCLTGDGEPVAFVWIEPAERTRYVAVRQRGFVEVYEVAADLPVRVATRTEVAADESAASLDVSEHDLRGAVLRKYRVEARVAG